MSAGKRFLTFLSGSVLGAAVGTATAVLWAPRSGTEMRGRLIDRIRQARLAGAEAKAAKEDELIQKFREDVEDPTALRDEEAKRRVEAAQAVAAIGLGLNAPGAIAAQEAALRRADAVSTPRVAPTSDTDPKRGT
ncbi:MAG: YtxH domain-containing protein [Chloroflexia bacterium]|nr:YtxH domain-containing protein [Chloroflexia bacterium]MDQ3411493.1 YtxH domain-containing protein [Chloroflexota bacterium]